jgi:catechol-2,3-dioxygenase
MSQAAARSPSLHTAGLSTMTGTKGAHMITWDKEIGVIELFFADLPEAKAFYADVLGLEVDQEDDTSVSFVLGE